MCKKIPFIILIIALAALVVPGFAIADSIQAKGVLARIDVPSSSFVVNTREGFLTLKVDASTAVMNYGKAAMMAQLNFGDRIVLRYDPETMIASYVSAQLPVIKGYITSIERGPLMTAITVAPLGGDPVSISMGATTPVERDHQLAATADLAVQDYVEASYNPATRNTEKIKLLPSPQMLRVEGIIQDIFGVVGGDVRVTIVKPGLTRMIVNVGMSADLERTGVLILPFQMRKGEHILAFYNGIGMQAYYVWVWGPGVKMLEGAIINIQYPTKFEASVTIGSATGAPVKITISAATTYERDHQKGTFQQVNVNDPSRAFYNPLTKEMIHLETWTTK